MHHSSVKMADSSKPFFADQKWILWALTFHCLSLCQAMMQMSLKSSPRVAIIGGGAAGLACARVFSRRGRNDGDDDWCVTVLEKDTQVGGVWNYRESDTKTRPMYRGLRTNLPKETMEYREFPWPKLSDDEDKDPSFVTHKQVQNYLMEYSQKFDIQVCLQHEVTQLRVLSGEDHTPSCFSPTEGETWPKIELTIVDHTNATNGEVANETRQVFDAVLVANGHFNAPRTPRIPGVEEYFVQGQGGRVFHSIEYDDPSEFRDQTVLCIGGRASGSDIAREIARAGAKQVYLSDSSRTTGEARYLDRITWVPRTMQVLANGAIQFDHDCPVQAEGVDTIILCTGYDYSFPFINQQSGLELDSRDRRVQPLYEQLWHARYPHIAFVGLPHSILPFPLFEFQAEACLNMWQTGTFPSVTARLQAAEAAKGGEGKVNGRIEDTHYLGQAQWDYCTRMAKYAGLYDEDMESYLAVNKVSFCEKCICFL